MILVSALKRLFRNSSDDECQTRSSFSWSINRTRSAGRRYLTVENLTALAGHDCAIGLGRNDRGDYLAGRFLDRVELAVEQACRTVVRADPQRAGIIYFQRQHA